MTVKESVKKQLKKPRKTVMRDLQVFVNVKNKEIQQRPLRNVRTVLTVKVRESVLRVIVIIREIKKQPKNVKKQPKKPILDQDQHKQSVRTNMGCCKTFAAKWVIFDIILVLYVMSEFHRCHLLRKCVVDAIWNRSCPKSFLQKII